jgi:hypothetical protein
MKELGKRALHHNGQSAAHVADEAAGYPLLGELILIISSGLRVLYMWFGWDKCDRDCGIHTGLGPKREFVPDVSMRT